MRDNPAVMLSDDFLEFTGHSWLTAADGEPLARFIYAWLTEGDAIAQSGGDYSFYLRGVIDVIERWLANPSILDFKGTSDHEPEQRRADGLGFDVIPEVLEPEFYRVLLFRLTHKIGEGAELRPSLD